MESHIVAALTGPLLAEACRRWSIDQGRLRLIRQYENFVYESELQATGAAGEGSREHRLTPRRAVLRITHASHRRIGDLQAELEFINSLADAGLPACRPLPSDGGALVEAIDGAFLASCFAYAPGTRMTWRDPAVWNTRSFRSWGRVLARFHRHAERYAPRGGTRRQRWDEDEVTCGHFLGVEDEDISARLAAAVRELRDRPTGPEEFGLIHGDLHGGNLFASPDDGALAVFDFDDASYHWYSYDLAVVFYHLPEGEGAAPPRPDRRSVMQDLLAGYAQERALPSGLAGDLRRFVLLRDMQMYQNQHKKTLPADRDTTWFEDAARKARRIRAGVLACELPS